VNAAPRPSGSPSLGDAIGATWTTFWFTPVGAWPLAAVRIGGGLLALALWAGYARDLETWFGASGMIPPGLLAAWRSPYGVSVFDFLPSSPLLWIAYLAGGLVLACVTVGALTPVTTVLGALAFASLLHRGPMLAGPADDVVAVILWCLAIGRSGDALSIDGGARSRLGRPSPAPSVRSRIALGLLRIHAAVIAGAAALAQLKGDVWWNGTAAWWLAARADSGLVDLTGLFLRSEYLLNVVTHAIVLFEALFAAGMWIPAVRRPLAIAGLVAWPLIGIVGGEPFWGLALAVLSLGCLPDAVESSA